MKWKPSAVACPKPMRTPSWIEALLDLAYPRLCLMCGRKLGAGEHDACTPCLSLLPRTDFHLHECNPMEEHFRGIVPVERTASLFHYQKGNPSCNLIHHLKYENCPDIGVRLGELLASEISPSGFFRDIDLLVPVPLSPKRLRRRGYNQAERIAHGVSRATGIPVDTTHLSRRHDNPTQTRQSRRERLDNTERLFTAFHSEELAGKHILLIDDVITTGATLRACAETLLTHTHIRISLLTLGSTRS